jgi:hypothetical protein
MGQITLANPHWEALTPETQQAFYKAASLPFISQFYLAGGTGLALHLGHRFSVDMDFFSPAPDAVGPDIRAVLRETLDDPTLSITHDKDATFVATWRGVGISFFRLQLYPLAQQPVLVEGVPVATVEEIGAMFRGGGAGVSGQTVGHRHDTGIGSLQDYLFRQGSAGVTSSMK